MLESELTGIQLMFDQTIFHANRRVSRYARTCQNVAGRLQLSGGPEVLVSLLCVTSHRHGKQAAWHCCWGAGRRTYWCGW